MNLAKSGLVVLVWSSILASSTVTMAVDCTVTSEASTSDAGTLGERMGLLNSGSCDGHSITFADGVNNIEIASTGSISQDSAVMDGGGDVTITSTSSGLSALMLISADNARFQNLTAINTHVNTAFPAVLTQDENVINTVFSGVSFSAAGVNVQLETGLNLLSQCNFKFIQAELSAVLGGSATRPLIKINGLLKALSNPSNFQARLSDSNIAEWTLTGEVDSSANRVEIYTVDAAAKTVRFLAATTASSGAFSFTFTMPATLPNQTFTFLGMNNTTGSFQMSQFSSAFTPTTDDASFYSDVPACEDVTWLVATQGGLTGDFDGDGLTNGSEDADANCGVDSGETNPASADSDADGVADGSDNCKTTGNADQADGDADGVGDICDAASPSGGSTADNGTPTDSGTGTADSDTDSSASTTTPADSGGGCSLIRAGVKK